MTADLDVLFAAAGFPPENRYEIDPKIAKPSAELSISTGGAAAEAEANERKEERTKKEIRKKASKIYAATSRSETEDAPRVASRAPNTHLKIPQALSLLDALRFAELKGMPLNTPIVVRFRGSRVYESGPATKAATSESRKLALHVIGMFAAQKGFSAAFIYILENPPCGGYGLHANLMVHLPPDDHDALRQELRLQFEAAFDWRPRQGGFQPINVKAQLATHDDGVRKLIADMRGIDPDATTYSQASGAGPKSQGTIIGKRAGCSQTIDRGARQQAGFDWPSTVGDLDAKTSIHRWRERNQAQVAKELAAMMRSAAAESLSRISCGTCDAAQ